MGNYKTEHGFQIKNRSSDPANPIEGEIWYNTTTGTLKVAPKLAAWSSGGNLNTGRINAGSASSGPRDASLYFAGETGPDNTMQTNESYDGSSWTELGDLNTGRRNVAGFGTQTAAVCAGGLIPPANPQTQDLVEEWNGSSWTEVTDVPVAGIPEAAGTGTLTAGMIFGGDVSTGDARTNKTYHYDGTNWTAGGDLNTGRRDLGSAGTQTAGLGFGGIPGGPNAGTNVTEEYDGSSWTSVNNKNNSTGAMGSGGTQTDAMGAGGFNDAATAATNTAEIYDGTTWTAAATLATARHDGGSTSASGSTASIYFGGHPPFLNNTEEYNNVATARSVDIS